MVLTVCRPLERQWTAPHKLYCCLIRGIIHKWIQIILLFCVGVGENYLIFLARFIPQSLKGSHKSLDRLPSFHSMRIVTLQLHYYIIQKPSRLRATELHGHGNFIVSSGGLSSLPHPSPWMHVTLQMEW